MRWFGKRRGKDGSNHHGQEHRAETLQSRRRKPRVGLDSGRGSGRPDGGCCGRPAVGPGRRPLAGRDRLRADRAGGRTADIRREVDRLRRPGRRHPPGRHRPGHPGAGLRRAAGGVAALLGLGDAGRGGADRLLAPPERTEAVLHRLMGGHPRPGRGAHGQARADPVPPAGRGGGALRPSHDFPGLDAGSGQRRHHVRVRHRRRGEGGASDGGGTRQRHRDVADGRPGDGNHVDRRRRYRRVAYQRRLRPQRRDPVPNRRARGRSDSRREPGREPGGEPPHSHPPADAVDPPPGAGGAGHQDRAPPSPGGQRLRQ